MRAKPRYRIHPAEHKEVCIYPRDVGEKYDAHHIIELSNGGDNEWWNIFPARFPDQHQGGIHAAGSASRELFRGGEK